jgi:anti-sigma28 factor (negative regulator of flagellin synthesis)
VSNKKGHNSPDTNDLHTLESDMIKTLRITSFLAVALAAVFVVFSVVFGVRSDKDIKGLLGEPDVIEKFNKSAGDKASRNTNQVSPLVQQAGKFALFLNPPEPKTPRQVASRTTSFKREPSVTPKFKVIVTSYYKDHPELSIAMIDEPGKGRNWVRQSSKVGHLFIEEIKDGVVVVKDSSGTFELKAEQKPHVSLLAGAPPVDAATTSISDQTAGRTESKPSTSVPARSSAYSGGTISRTAKIPRASLPGKTKEKESIMEEVAEKFAQLKSKIESGEYTDQEKAALYSEVIEEIKATWPKDLSKEEKESIGIITKELQKKMDEPTGSGQK